MDFDYDERQSRPREIPRLVSAVNSPPSEPGDRHTPEPAVQCHTVLVEILGAIDRGQATQALELFTPDASLEADGKQLHGRDEIASFLAEAQATRPPHAHLITNEVVRRATDDEIELTALTFHYEPQADVKVSSTPPRPSAARPTAGASTGEPAPHFTRCRPRQAARHPCRLMRGFTPSR